MKNTIYILVFLIGSQSFSQKISKLYENCNEAVVFIKTKRTESKGYGSGFVISEKGDIMTASHLVQTAEQIFVTFADGEEMEAKVMYSYPLADVALIRLSVPKNDLKVLKLGDSDKTKIGDEVFVIGAPFGLERSLSVGYISGKHKRESSANGLMTAEFIQCDAAINEGSSGAPVINKKGEVIGIASFIISRSHGFQGLGFAATSNIAKKILLEEKAIWTGLDLSFISDSFAEIFNIPQKGGILVQVVAKGSLGEFMGLQGGHYKIAIEDEELILGGDIILTVDKIPLIDEENLIKAWYKLQELGSGDYLSITILRKGKIIEISRTIL